MTSVSPFDEVLPADCDLDNGGVGLAAVLTPSLIPLDKALAFGFCTTTSDSLNLSKCKSTDQVLYLCSQLMYLHKSCIALNIVLQKLMNTTLTIQRVTVCTYEMNNC